MQNLNNADLNGLEAQINTLLRTVHQLRLENDTLRDKVTQLKQAHTHTEEKNHLAITEIKRIITQLKEEME